MDLDLFARVLLDGGSIVLDRTVGYRYRRHAGTVTSQNARCVHRSSPRRPTLGREVAARARRVGWSRTRRAAHLRLTQRANGTAALLRSIGRPATGRLDALRDLVTIR